MSNRAKRMKAALESLGWDCDSGDDRVSCYACGTAWQIGNFCKNCGSKLPKPKKTPGGADDLERSISYALGETKRKPTRE